MITTGVLNVYNVDSYTRKGFDPKAEGLAGLEWDSAELLMVKTCTYMYM